MNTPKREEGKATPGPWEVGGPFPSVSVIHCVDGGAGFPNPEPPTYYAICIVHQAIEGEQPKQALVDARLIAAAPELLEACKDALEILDMMMSLGLPIRENEGHPGSPRYKLTSAIAKATRATP